MENPVDKVDKSRKRRELSLHGPVLGLFAKQPRAGQVKTRLIAPLTAIEARELYHAALAESVTGFASSPATVVICGAGRSRWFARTFPDVPFLAQGRGDLGARLRRAVAALFAAVMGLGLGWLAAARAAGAARLD